MRETVAARFDDRAESYDNPLTAFLGERELRRIRPWVPDGCAVLDYGCGTGRTTLDLLRRGCTVTAFDISAEMLAIAEHKAQAAGHSAEWVVDDTALAGRTWPVITLIGVLDYYRDPTPILKQVVAHLAPEGRIVATQPNLASPLAWCYGLASRFTVPATPRTAGFARKMVERAGLRLTGLRYACPGLPPLGHTMVMELRHA